MAAAETRVFLQQFFEREFKEHGSAERACKLLQDYQKREKELIISVSFKKISTIFMNMRENLCMCGWGWWGGMMGEFEYQGTATAISCSQNEVAKFQSLRSLKVLCI